MLSSSYRTISATLAGVVIAAAISVLPQEVRAENKISATTTFRATIDSGVGGGINEVAGAFGSVVVGRQGAKQSFVVDVHNLAGSGYGVFSGDTFTTNFPAFLIAALDQRNVTNGSWILKFTSKNGALPQLGVADVTNLVDKIIYIATPGTTNITGGVTNLVDCTTNVVGSITNLVDCTTNLVGCTTNVVGGVTNLVDCTTNVVDCATNAVGGVTNLVGCTTNIVGSVTNIIVGAVLWAPIPDFSAKPGKESFKRSKALKLPVAPPSPRSHGSIKVQFVGPKGQSVLDMRAMALPRGGHVYKVWMEDGLSFTNIGSLALSVSEANGRFLRDTRKGQPLPLQARQIGDLSGRSILIIDEFDEIVLEGVIP